MRNVRWLFLLLACCIAACQTPQSPPAQDAMREELQREIKAAEALEAEIQKGYKALENDLMAGRMQRIPLRERRKELHEKDEQLKKLQESIAAKRKALGEEAPPPKGAAPAKAPSS